MQIIASENSRLDIFLSSQLQKSRNSIGALIRSNAIKIDGVVVAKPSHKLTIGSIVEIELPKTPEIDPAPTVDFDIDILYEDDSFLVVNKPANIVVHPASTHKEATLVDWLQSKSYTLSTISGELRNGIVHRLDKETTGGLIIAKTDTAHQKIAAQLEDRSLGRYYLAVIDLPLKESVVIDKPIARHPTKRTKMAVVQNGKMAKTSFVKLAELDGFELIAAKLYTGRTHQIRVHLSSINRHIIGDELYGYKPPKDKIDGFFLHAFKLDLVHPNTNKRVDLFVPLPTHFVSLLQKHYTKDEIDEIICNIGRYFNSPNRMP